MLSRGKVRRLNKARLPLFHGSRDVLQPPGGTTARPQRLAVQGGCDPSQRVAALTQVTDFREHALLALVWFDVLAVRAETESEPDIPDPLPLVRLCGRASRVRSPIASLSHWLTNTMATFEEAANAAADKRAFITTLSCYWQVNGVIQSSCRGFLMLKCLGLPEQIAVPWCQWRDFQLLLYNSTVIGTLASG